MNTRRYLFKLPSGIDLQNREVSGCSKYGYTILIQTRVFGVEYELVGTEPGMVSKID
jgi:hypothetical protein